MNRRWAGLMVVLLVILAAAIVTSLSRTRIAGMAKAAPPPGPPAVGDCLVDSISVTDIFLEDDNSPPKAYPSFPLTRCAGDRRGEVSKLVATAPGSPRTATSKISADGGFDAELKYDPVAIDCQRAAETYIGAPNADHFFSFSDTPNEWFTVADVLSAVVRPDARQLAVGQTWAACIAMLSSDADAAGNFVSSSYSGSLKNAYHSGYPGSDLISLCDKDDTDPTQTGTTSVACDRPHRVEYLAYTQTDGKMSQAELQRTCDAVGKTRIGGVDATRGGQLSIEAIALYTADDGETKIGVHADGSAICRVSPATPGRLLVHSVTNLGDRPVPFA